MAVSAMHVQSKVRTLSLVVDLKCNTDINEWRFFFFIIEDSKM